MTESTTLLSDPVFQLNTFLWAVEDLPAVGEITPVLRNAGYYLNSIGRSVIAPTGPTVLEALSTLIGTRDRTPSRPDLWLKHSTDETDPLIELKARGFSVTSSNSRQALKLLASAVDLAPSLAKPQPQRGHVIYATVADDAHAMSNTLAELREKLADAGVPAAPAGCIGLAEEADGITLSSPQVAELPGPAQPALETPAVVLHRTGSGNDLVPLYFVPWIPGIDDSQDPELRSQGLRELTARLLTHTIATIGQAQIPCTVSLIAGEVLNSATFGIFSRWRDNDRKQFGLAAGNLIERALRSTGAVRLESDRVEIDLPTAESQHAAIERLEGADPADPSKNLEAVVEEPPTLFDDLDDRSVSS